MALWNSGLNLQRSGVVCVSSFCIPCPHPDTTGPRKSQALPPFHMSEGGQLDSVTSQVAVGRGYAVCSPWSSARSEIHISWRCPRGLFPSVLVLPGEKGSELERPVCGGEGLRGTGRTHCKGMLSLPWEQLPWRLFASQQQSNRPFCGRAANDTIKFIRRTSVLNDRTTGCPLREAGLKQLKNQEPGASKPSLQILSAISKLNHQYPWRVCRHLRT